MFKFELGDLLKDRVTGLVGVAIARIEYLNGCRQYCLKPQKLDDKGVPLEGQYFDEGQLVLKKSKVVDIGKKAVGGPSTNPLPRL